MADEKAVNLAPRSHIAEVGQEPEWKSNSASLPPENGYSARRKPRIELERYISLKPMVSFGLTLQASWEAVAVSFQAALLNGGSTSLVYGMLLVWLGCSALAASLGEMASVDPAVGAQYRWAARYAPSSMKPAFWGLMQGWLTVVAWMASCALTPFVLGTMIQSMIIFNYPNYVPQRWHATLLMWACTVVPVVCNFYARRTLVALEMIGGICHFLFFIITVVVLGILAPRSTNEFVWTTSVSGISGWDNPGVAFCLGLLVPAFCLAGFDGVLHMSDETKDAPRQAPRSMFLTVAINGVFAFAFIICLLYCIGDTQALLSSPSLPILLVFYTATKSVAATNALMVMILFVCFVGNFSVFASVSRLTWAFARDRGLPFPEFFSYVHPTLKIPTNALYLVAILCCLLALINIPSTTAFYAVISLATFSLYLSYIPPLVFLVIRKLEGKAPPRGPWNLGRWGLPINIFAICYAVFMVIWLTFPTTRPVTKDTMNYAAPVWITCFVLALADYFISGHKRFRLPDDMKHVDGVEPAVT
ncbi:amino acid transporter [Glonium stellatum]|uniref:Amino acid transporter n=1 Tax=Glonium stellatum TaxID=574774 RepID=A0A8E2F5I0_9PEZI|nr:amino acid transporter [Glonium stellatum]